jgi:hypothetical protein
VQGPDSAGHLDTYTITSDYQKSPCKLYVLLPDKFDKARQYKVLYVLPVNKAPSASGIFEVRKLGLANKYDVICVGPDFTGTPWYGDNPDIPNARNDTYLPDVIVPFIDKTYPTLAKPEGRLLVGFSKSGIGSVTLLLRYPELFGRAGAWDAPLILPHAKEEYFGSEENFQANYFLPTLLKKRLAMLKGQPARIAIVGYGLFETDTNEAHKLMNDLGVPHYFDNAIKRQHDWSTGWMGPLVEALMADDMTKAKPAEK